MKTEVYKLKTCGPVKPEVLECWVDSGEVNVEYRDSYDRVWHLQGDLQCEIEDASEYMGYFYVDTLYFVAIDAECDINVLDAVNTELESYEDFDMIQDRIIDAAESSFDSIYDR